MGETTVLIRLGRALYWLALGVGGLGALFFVANAIHNFNSDPGFALMLAIIGGAIGLAGYVSGRLIRYILANE
jgi:hypothetical protein